MPPSYPTFFQRDDPLGLDEKIVSDQVRIRRPKKDKTPVSSAVGGSHSSKPGVQFIQLGVQTTNLESDPYLFSDKSSSKMGVPASSTKMSKDPYYTQSFQDGIHEGIQETNRTRESRILSPNNNDDTTNNNPDSPRSSALIDSFRDISVVASGTLQSMREWVHREGLGGVVEKSNSTTSDDEQGDEKEENDDTFSTTWEPRPPPSPLKKASSGRYNSSSRPFDFELEGKSNESDGAVSEGPPRPRPQQGSITSFGYGSNNSSSTGMVKHSILQDLAWPLVACGVSEKDIQRKKDELVPHIRRIRETFQNTISETQFATDLWRFGGNDDLASIVTMDTIQEDENNQIRRLASWGTVQTFQTIDTSLQTIDTSLLSRESATTSSSAFVHETRPFHDDEGHPIDPKLLQWSHQDGRKSKASSSSRRKVVKFEYPPISSMKVIPRPDPRDLKHLFFTERELDQIEDDRYSTMSTDDVEIVAVSSKADEIGASSSFSRRSHHNAEQDDKQRLVRGVQIFLRERSTGV
jgi:hypothetical protein